LGEIGYHSIAIGDGNDLKAEIEEGVGLVFGLKGHGEGEDTPRTLPSGIDQSLLDVGQLELIVEHLLRWDIVTVLRCFNVRKQCEGQQDQPYSGQ
jgi:hypothetical protein